MRFTRWFDQSQPQTLQISVFLLYFDVVFGVLRGTIAFFPLGTLLVVGAAVGGVGVANRLRWAWKLAVAVSVAGLLPFVLVLVNDGVGQLFRPALLLAALFPVAQFAALVHPISRQYQKLWFE